MLTQLLEDKRPGITNPWQEYREPYICISIPTANLELQSSGVDLCRDIEDMQTPQTFFLWGHHCWALCFWGFIISLHDPFLKCNGKKAFGDCSLVSYVCHIYINIYTYRSLLNFEKTTTTKRKCVKAVLVDKITLILLLRLSPFV